jgi:hypothetical protein
MLQVWGLNSGLKESNLSRNYSKRDRKVPDIYIYIYIYMETRVGMCVNVNGKLQFVELIFNSSTIIIIFPF